MSILNNRLGLAESACLILAVETGADLLILDDRSARLEAQTLGLRVTGTVGILLKADEKGLIRFDISLDDLLETGFRLNPQERDRILERWRVRKQSPGS